MNDYNQNQNPKKPEQPKKTGNGEDAKKEKINRIIYVSAVALLLAMVIIAAVVSSTNRAKLPPSETPETNETPKETLPTPDTRPESKPEEKPEETPKVPDKDVASKLPTFAAPVNGTLSVKHDPEMQVLSPTMGDYRVHLGIDINAEEKAAVSAAADGKVLKIWEDVKMGWCIAVSHSGEAVTYYKNLDKTLAEGIKEGATVSAGQLLGAIGESAMVEVAQEPHLHFEMTVGGIQVDPMEYLGDNAVATLNQDTSYEG